MIFPEIDIDELLDAQLICRLWHAIRNIDARATFPRVNPHTINPQTRHAIQTIDPETYHEIFTSS